MTNKLLKLLIVVQVLLSLNISAAPITFNTALPVAKGAFVNREQFIFKRFKDDKSPAGRDLSVNGLVSVLAYGINSKLAVFAAVPYLQKDIDLTANNARINRTSNGIADSKFFARYTFMQKDEQAQTLRLAGFAGVKAPTGEDQQSDIFGVLPTPLQSGSGSWDNFFGLVLTRQKLDYQIDLQLSYNNTGTANQFEAGNTFNADASFQYRIFPNNLSDGNNHFIYAVLEANYSQQDNNRIMGAKDNNSGGSRLFISPGIQYVTRKYILEAAIQLPVEQNLNGFALETDYVVTTGFRINF
jgi:hypothetical protein